jgi:WD40 repeat protein
VSAITHLPSTPEAPKGVSFSMHSSPQLNTIRLGYAATGGQDAIINVYNLASGSAEPERALVGHTQNVCALHASAEGTIISGSWDS